MRLVLAVNAATDPLLANTAKAGELNKLEDGTLLAEPFVFHDPGVPVFALVVPVTLAHRELELRAELLKSLALAQQQSADPIPAYVRRADTVLGARGLAALLQQGPEADSKSEQVAQLAQREERLRVRAEEVTRREDELLERREEVDEATQKVAEARASLEQLRRRLEEDRRGLEADRESFEMRAADLARRVAEATAAQPRTPPVVEPVEEATTVGPSLVAAVVAAQESPPEPEEALEAEAIEPAPQEAAEEVVEAEAVEPLDETEVSEEAEELGRESVEPLEPEELTPEPAEKARPRAKENYAAVVDNEARFWARTNPESAARAVRDGAVLLLQTEPESTAPVAVLSATFEKGELLARCVLDSTRPDDRDVVEALARDFRVRLELVSAEGRSLGTIAIAAPCEDNARRIGRVLSERSARLDGQRWDDAERAEVLPRLLAQGVDAAKGRALAALAGEDAPLRTATQVVDALALYDEVLDAARLESFLLSQGVAASQLEVVGRRLVLTAMRTGVPLSPAMVEFALQKGIASDEKSLATRALTAFARSTEQPLESVGHTRRSAYEACSGLLAWARKLGVEEHEAARAAAVRLFDPDDPEAVPPADGRAAPEVAQLEGLAEDALCAWALCPKAQEVLPEFLLRKDPSKHQKALGWVLRLYPAMRAAELTATLLPQGDALGDLWVELLASPRAQAAVLGAVAASEVRLRRALNPLLARCFAPEQAASALFGWAAGNFGVAVVKALQARHESLDVDAASWVLAHAIRVGAGRDVEKVRAQAQGSLAEATMRATGRVDEARLFDQELRVGRGATPGAALAFEVLRRVGGERA